MSNKKVSQEVDITGDGNVVGDGSVAQVAKAINGGAIGDVKQIAFVIQGAEAGQAVAMELGEVHRLIEEVRAYLPTKSQWTVTESGENRLAVETRRPVTAPLHFRLQSLIEDYTALFAGREDEIAEIEAFLRRSEGGYIFVTGKSGFGKTALLANLIAKKRPPIGEQERTEPGPYLYHFLSYLRGTRRREDMLRNLCQQMMAYYQIEGRLPSRVDDLEALYARLIRLPLVREDRPFVLVIDGIDEADGGFISNLHIPAELPAGKTVIFSARETGVDWLGELGIPRERTHVLQLERFGARGVRRLLREAGGHAEELAEDKAFVKQVLDVSEGEPFYLRYLTEDIRDGVIGVDNIGRQPVGLSRYLDGWWRELSAQVREEEARQLLGLLLVARAPLPRSDILGIYPELTWGLDGILQASRRFIVGNDERGYALCHPRFREHLADKLETVVTKYRQALLDYCARWREHESPYALRHYAAHLAEIGDTEALRVLLTREWAEARRRLDGDYTVFLEDIEETWILADEQREIGLQMRCALLRSTIRTLIMKLPAKLVCAAIEKDIWSPQTALNYFFQWENLKQRRLLAAYLPTALLLKALENAKRMENLEDRGRSLVALAPHLPQDLRERVLCNALNALKNMKWNEGLAGALVSLAPYLTSKLVPEALDIIQQIYRNTSAQIEARAALARHFSHDLQEKTLRESLKVITITGGSRTKALALLVPHLPPDLLRQALNAAREMDRASGRSMTIAILAPQFPPNSREQILNEALEAAQEIDIAYTRSEILAILSPYFPSYLQDKLQNEALNIAQRIEWDGRRCRTLASLVPYLPPSLQTRISEEVLEIIPRIDKSKWQLHSLATIAPYLPPTLVKKAIDVYQKIDIDDSSQIFWLRSALLYYASEHFPENPLMQVSSSPEMKKELSFAREYDDLEVLFGEETFFNEYTNSLSGHSESKLADVVQVLRARRYSIERRETIMVTHHYSILKEISKVTTTYRDWVATLHTLSDFARPYFVDFARALIPRIAEYGGEDAILEAWQALQDVTEWWP